MQFTEKIKSFFQFLFLEKPTQKKKKKAYQQVEKEPDTVWLEKHSENPIIAPDPKNDWESWQTFNPGALLLDNHVHFLYRAIGSDGLSRFGYAFSEDGLSIDRRLAFPAYEHEIRSYSLVSYPSGGSFGGAEDPRIVRIEDEPYIYITYTACDGGLRVGLSRIHIDDFRKGRWNWSVPKLISSQGETHKNWIIFPEKINGKYAIMHSLNPEIQVAYLDDLNFSNNETITSFFRSEERKDVWDKWIRGVGPTPIKTDKGWLVFYHAMDDDWSKYKVGAMLLNLEDPTKVIYRAKSPILEPSEEYENCGFKSGVVYVSGAVVKDGVLYIYYGGADSYVCVAYENLDTFLEELTRDEKPHLQKKTLTKK